jgi:hypothetical protein
MEFIIYIIQLIFEVTIGFFAWWLMALLLLFSWWLMALLGFFGTLLILGLVVIPLTTLPYVVYRFFHKKISSSELIGHLISTSIYTAIFSVVVFVIYNFLYDFLIYTLSHIVVIIGFIGGFIGAIILLFLVLKHDIADERRKLFGYLFD